MQRKGVGKYLRQLIKRYRNVFVVEPIDSTVDYWFGNVLGKAGFDIYSWQKNYVNEWMTSRLFRARNSFL